VPPLLTVGHGLLTIDELGRLLRGAGAMLLVDVRAYPTSRRNLDARRGRLAEGLGTFGITYRWEPRLGGRRSATPEVTDPALTDLSLRAYAAHMRSPEFRSAMGELLAEADRHTVAILCAEGDPRRCHRSLVADHVTLMHGHEVLHLRHSGALDPHEPHPGARRDEEGVHYDRGTPPPLPGM
jgi:uncharacterized protein (DUF488 family)